jgi:hypothetical protein
MFCCGDESDASLGPLNKEHFVPKCLWENNRPPFTRTVLAHTMCNAALSKDNEYFRDVLVFEAGADVHPEVRKLRQGKISRKFTEAPGDIAKTLKDIAILPVETQSGIYVEQAPAFLADRTRIDRVLYNVMRGIFYSVNKQPMPMDWRYGIKRLEEIRSEDLEEVNAQTPPEWHTFGDDVFACRYIFGFSRRISGCIARLREKCERRSLREKRAGFGSE